MRDTDPETNAFAELSRRINKMNPNMDRGPILPSDRRIGKVSESTLRTEARCQYLHAETKRYANIINEESDTGRREHLMIILDELEIELAHALALYLSQLPKERELCNWEGPAIFTLRTEETAGATHVVAVIENRNFEKYLRRCARPYKPGDTMRYFREIVLGE